MAPSDPFALGGRQESDDPILALFRKWRDEMEFLGAEKLDDLEYETRIEALIEVQRQLFDADASGPIGLAIKAFMLAYEVRVNEGNYIAGDHQCSINAFDQRHYGAKRTLFLDSHALRGLVVDVVRFLPELEPLCRRIISAPVVLPLTMSGQAVDGLRKIASEGGT